MSSGEECSGNLLLFLVDINNIALLSLLTDYWDAIRILGSDFVSLILAFLCEYVIESNHGEKEKIIAGY